ncbi:MAG: glycosyltransferase family 2 protein [Flavobacteriaceae bacterium]|nr:glycosyltransferase family 2 protein [Flavobacteriaceae bacterium]
MKIAVVVLNWNGRSLLEEYLPVLVKNTDNSDDIYIIDNNSTDDSIEYIENNFRQIKIVQLEENNGFAKGYNLGLKDIEADVYCLLNSDVRVSENWLDPIKKEYKKNPSTAIIQPKILDDKNKTHFEYAGAAGGFIDKYGYAYARGRVFDTIEKDNGQYDDDCSINWASGACMFVRKEVFDNLGGFDDDYFAHYEEIDFCWRAINKGFEIKYIHNSTVYHLGGGTLDNSSPFKTYLNFRNSLFTLLKNLPKEKLFTVIFTRLVLDGLAGVMFFFKGKFKNILAIIKAHFSFYSGLRKMCKKRGFNSKTKKYYRSTSIVKSYYLKGNNKFD